MGLQPTPLNLALIAAELACLPLGYFAWRRRSEPGARPLAALAVGITLWVAAELASDVAVGRGASAFWGKFAYAGITLTVLAFFLFTIEYTGRDRLVTDRALAVLSVEPLAMVVLVWTNGVHGLMWAEVSYDPAREAMLNGLVVAEHGAGFYVHIVYSYLLVCAGAYFLLQRVAHRSDIYRGQAAALAVGAAGPVTGNLLYVFDVVATDLTPVGFAVSGVAFFYATFAFELMNITPVARATVVENISDGVFVLDTNDRIVDINPEGKRILGLEGERVLGRHARESLSVYPGLYERYEDTLSAQEEIGLDDGEARRYFHIKVSPLYDSRDRLVGRLFLVHDITDQKRRQQELQRQNQRLDQFASLVSHDLRNPLNVADGYVDIARETGDTEYLDKVDDSLERMGDLIDDVLTLARQGQTITETEPVELTEVAREAWSNVDTAEAVLEIRAEARFEANYGRVLRVFENLFRNAVEHGGNDVRIRVGVLGSGESEELLRPDERGFYVEDDGPGIPPGERESVLQDGYTTSDDGTGLGLSIVRSIVQAHGWEVRITEGRDGGARFEVTGVDPAGTEPARQEARADGGD